VKPSHTVFEPIKKIAVFKVQHVRVVNTHEMTLVYSGLLKEKCRKVFVESFSVV